MLKSYRVHIGIFMTLILITVLTYIVLIPKATFAESGNDDIQNNFKEVTSDEADPNALAVNDQGELIYKNKILLVGANGKPIPKDIFQVMQKGVTQKIIKKDSLLSSFSKVFKPISVYASDSNPIITLGKWHYWSYWGTVEFYIDGEFAYCIEHTKPTPATNQPYKPIILYNNEKMQKALYYGWGGPGNIFTNKSEGIVVTHLVLSKIYSGESSAEYSTAFKKLWDKVENGKVPDSSVSFSDTNLAISVINNKQVSQTTTFKADKNNSFNINLPKNVTLVNETKKKSSTGGSIAISGGDKFHFEAPLNYNKAFTSGDLRGDMKRFQPIITKPKSSSYQTLGTWRYYRDPRDTASFSVPFKAQTVTMTKIYKDEFTGNTIDSDTSTVTIGSTYRACGPNELSYQGYPMIKKTWCSEGTVPNKNFTKTFWYNSEHTLKIDYYNRHNGNFIKTKHNSKYQAGKTYNVNLDATLSSGDTTYKIESPTLISSGTMGRGNKSFKVYYQPYNDINVTWKNRYPGYDVFKQESDSLKVGSTYKYTQPSTFSKSGLIYDRENNTNFSGTLGYNDLNHTFFYRLRRNVAVNYKDNRNGDVIKSPKNYDLVQGNSYSESPVTIEKDAYTYRYVKHSGDPESGTIGTSNVAMTYHYDLPLAKVGLEKIQIFTAPSSEGLPVKVKLSKANNYQVAVPDMTDSTKSITVALYQGSTKIDAKTYVAKNLPYDLSFTIPPNVLNKNENKPYTVKFEDYDTNNWDVISGQDEVTTDGYTSSERMIQVDAATNDYLSYQGVVMTEREAGKTMKVFYETLDIPLTKLDSIRTGYGFEMPIDMSYQNDLGNGSTNFSFNMFAPMDIVDDTYVEYETNGNIATVPLELTNNVTSTDKTSSKQLFELQHMNVEHMTGHLFTDQQVAANDSRIEKEIISGDRKFYLPIWGYVGKYDFNVASDEKIGINQIAVNIDYTLDVVGHMYLHMDSLTKDKDAIHFEPINKDDPFPNGIPNNWTDEDVEAFYAWLEE